jgi:hypothetical protein
MKKRLVARLVVVLALVVPIAASGQKPNLPSTLSVTLNMSGDAPARLKYAGRHQTFDAQSETMKAEYSAGGLTVEMRVGSYVGTSSDPVPRTNQDTFKRLNLTFAPNGDLLTIYPSKD